ncbi:AMP phosphorylase [Candidatus Pacearchaeota archaeon CG1_02_32_132]|uniref:AMP phosphorylase n=1 Tax=uncultured Candidatus Pacearchaeota archaeon TaxID=2109283 RepID=A0A447ITX8_9ARCH|nr:MAG: AMP phosphorylase [Candidatus Pacearchaeota archaeon CG1_02_32_132]VDS10970.1 AMP phosphorylase [uncultured Candidatus Pacearchaeota archaeon]
MRFRIKSFKIGAGKPIVFVHKTDAKNLGIHVGNRVELSADGKRIIAVVDLVGNYFEPGEIGVSEDIARRLETKSGDSINLTFIPAPQSTRIIKKKLTCQPYAKRELNIIIKDIVNNAITEAEIAYFISGVYHCGMSEEETINLTDAIYNNGQKISWSSNKIADKHSIGGIPGNRTTPIVVSICAEAGVIMPKTSSRAITSAAGTADVIETLTRVDLSIKELKKVVKKTNACLAWGGSLGLAPADDKLIQIERLINLDPEPQLIASILAKKLAAGSKYVLIDIPYGKNAKATLSKAKRLKKKFLKIGGHFGLKIKVILTDGSQIIGNGIGPVLEMIDILKVLKREDSPKDLEDKSLKMAGVIMEMTGNAKKGQGIKKAKEILESGKAFRKFKEIIEAQGGKIKTLKPGKFSQGITSLKSGKIKEIDGRSIAHTARLAGCPSDKSAGIYIQKHIGEKISKGEIIATIYSESNHKLREAIEFFNEFNPIKF